MGDPMPPEHPPLAANSPDIFTDYYTGAPIPFYVDSQVTSRHIVLDHIQVGATLAFSLSLTSDTQANGGTISAAYNPVTFILGTHPPSTAHRLTHARSQPGHRAGSAALSPVRVQTQQDRPRLALGPQVHRGTQVPHLPRQLGWLQAHRKRAPAVRPAKCVAPKR